MREHRGNEVIVPGFLRVALLFIPVIIVFIIVMYEINSPNSFYHDLQDKETASGDYKLANAYYETQDYQSALNILLPYKGREDITPEMIILISQCENELNKILFEQQEQDKEEFINLIQQLYDENRFDEVIIRIEGRQIEDPIIDNIRKETESKLAEVEENEIVFLIEERDFSSAKLKLDNVKYMPTILKEQYLAKVNVGITDTYFEEFKKLSDIDDQMSMIIKIKGVALSGEHKNDFEKEILDAISRYSKKTIDSLSSYSSYEEKIQYLKNANAYYNTDEISNALRKIEDEYVNNVLSNVDNIYKAQGTAGVISSLEEAGSVVANEDINNAISYWKNKEKNKIKINEKNIDTGKLILITSTKSDVIKPRFFDDGLEDAFGNKYAWGFYVENDDYLYPADPGEAEFLLNKEYDYLRFTYAPAKERSSGGNPWLKVYVDDELALDVPAFEDPYIPPVTAVIDVKGADRVLFKVPGGSLWSDGPNGRWLVFEPILE